ncbi:MAG: LacI family DNA-binding transcriptional regulator [Deltaproteobacteria bacterium]|nr:LacI family DNA-binding transcriptional regulator [Deltaproteobacteria bacterium]
MLKQKVKRATLTDVARLAKVSSTSVSNVVNGRDGEMRPRTKKLILRAIEELDYTPNLAARRLRTGHASAIGLIVPSISYPFFGSFARLVEEVASTYGYHLLLANSDRDPAKERRIAEELLGYGVQGIIFGSSPPRLTHLENLKSTVWGSIIYRSHDCSAHTCSPLAIDELPLFRDRFER